MLQYIEQRLMEYEEEEMAHQGDHSSQDEEGDFGNPDEDFDN